MPERHTDAAAVPVPDAGGTWGGIDFTAVKVLIDHQRRDAGSCICDWGVDTGNLGQSHALHVWRELQAVGVTLPVPDTGDDVLREQLAELLHGIDKDNAAEEFGLTFRDWSKLPESAGEHFRARAGALLPLFRAHVAAATAQLDRDINDRVNVLSKLREALYEGGQYDEHRARKARAIIHEWETGR